MNLPSYSNMSALEFFIGAILSFNSDPCGVTVTIEENGCGDLSSSSGRGCLVFTSLNYKCFNAITVNFSIDHKIFCSKFCVRPAVLVDL